MASSKINAVVKRLENDWDYIAEFLNDPNKALKGYNLSKKERKLLTTKDVNGLIYLGISEDKAIVAASGAHSQTCA